MSCYHPRPAFEVVDLSTGEVSYSIWHPPGSPSEYPHFKKIVREFKVPCRQCIGCRDGDSSQWGRRCSHEALYHKENCFLTLTVSPEYLDEVFPGGSLRYAPFQIFLRAFRKRLKRKLRFFMCGEYGGKLERPHYHSIIFGWYPDLDDRVFLKKTPVGTLYTSRFLTSLWKFGFHSVGCFSEASANYVAGYIQKKINGKLKASWYGKLAPEFMKCSLGGRKGKGIGSQYYHDFKRDMYDHRDGETLRGGVVVPPGRYYDNLHSFYHPVHMAKKKEIRALPDSVRDFMNSPDQLRKREVIHRSRRKAVDRNNF